MSELLYPDTQVDVTCTTCGKTFRRPEWGKAMECTDCGGYVMYGADEHSPIYSINGVELVAQQWNGGFYLGTRQIDFDRTVEQHPQNTEDNARQEGNQVIGISDNEARVYAERILALLS